MKFILLSFKTIFFSNIFHMNDINDLNESSSLQRIGYLMFDRLAKERHVLNSAILSLICSRVVFSHYSTTIS